MDAKARQKTLRMLSNGIYVLTSRSGERCGAATVSWVSQASFKPPLVMAALRPDCNVFRCLAESGAAALHIVGESQQDVARRFVFTTAAGDGRINGEPVEEGRTRAPLLANLPARLECQVERIVHTGGDHAIVILRVVEAQYAETVRPLTIAQSPWEYGG
jgi:flavin reductase (DIM6/NTAB) family NADH-FMN oxidoreductase RutF